MDKRYIDIQKKAFSSEFYEFCRKKIKVSMQSIEKERKYVLNLIIAILSISVIVFATIVVLNLSSFKNINSHDMENILTFVVLYWGFVIAICSFIVKQFKKKAKKAILPKILSFIGEFEIVEDSYHPTALNSYVSTLMLFDNYNRFSCDDSLGGYYNGLYVHIDEIRLKRVTGSGKNRHTEKIFDGLLIRFKSFKKFSSKTVIKLNGCFDFLSKQKVNLEDPEFEKVYDVYSYDQIEARYLITPAFMQRLLELRNKKIGSGIVVSFENGMVHIGVSSSKDWFEVPLLESATNIANYRAILLEIVSILSIIDIMKFDENIGM
ncbi:MAG: DUF3137 domain-containing protein [Cyanobacteria bacterium SIG29]|nr:DUF3137 domain-containing protein [Cyanobacteria bacterium SIG29]